VESEQPRDLASLLQVLLKFSWSVEVKNHPIIIKHVLVVFPLRENILQEYESLSKFIPCAVF
jgi:hypothetical protein